MRTVLIVAAAAVAAGSATAVAQPRAGSPRPGGFSSVVTNPYFPLRPGMRWVYRGREGGAPARDVVRVLSHVETVDGVPCATVSDLLYHRGRLVERTTDWYTQDRRGRVWYYGEDTAELDRRGRVRSTEGTWRAGRRGARPGVFMPRNPKPGDAFQQEHLPGHAEDHFAVVSRRATVRAPYFGSERRRALLTREWTPLEPRLLDHKWYVRGIGEVAEVTVRGGTDRLRLTAFRR